MSTGAAPSFAEASRSLLRRTLLESARELAADRPWKAVTMAAIATQAGVSRQTVYNEFGSRPALTQALVMHEVDEFLTAVEGAIRERADDPAAALTAALGVFLTAAAEDPLVSAVTREDGREDLLPLVTSQGAPLLRHATDRLAGIVAETWPVVTASEADFLAECIVRLGLSYVVLPVTSTSTTAEGVASLMRPYIEGLLAR
jgi:AcrR family transcriptional regulator